MKMEEWIARRRIMLIGKQVGEVRLRSLIVGIVQPVLMFRSKIKSTQQNNTESTCTRVGFPGL